MKIEIEQKGIEAINWDIPQLLIADNGEVIITTGDSDYDSFEGFNFNRKRFEDNWAKSSCFKKFNGKITLSNE